ncbi:glycosyltransferase family 2 protein [Aeromicrobium chenweiae]|uniref:Glycosyltransferase family 2 protein n=1 Tax=Aeromicrobium chenweiae TaxID=2079793 RepID=A0A2S0WQM4_9ACTN|nr:glycosyltransferase family A protein [Aeromicrobium chenweiae]AWB93621.1 glycosyltransferase family 2 protein [Aeromicrobium chenweiae]TGN33270.1 glycosyltransferase family 2 protein [Aeromicrobium chenweiae]
MQVAVVVPVFDQEAWLPAALQSLQRQSFTDWECVVVADGSPGDTATAAAAALEDPRVTIVEDPVNRGLGAALNRGLDLTSAPLVTYLPADDVMHTEHLSSLVAALEGDPAAPLAVTGLRHDTDRLSVGRIADEPLQLVQVMHRRTPDRWIERDELTTDDLDRMLWDRLLAAGSPTSTGRVTATWTSHPDQRHRRMREPWGGINPYRSRYSVPGPLRFHSTVGHLHDEVEHYRRFRDRPRVPRAADGLRILLVGELAHNPDRVLTLAERGHELYGLWTDGPHWFNTVGPVPFGHVTEVPRDGWQDAVRDLAPDVIYGLLNWQAVPFVHSVLTADLGIPFVWHFKEGPWFSRQHGHWPMLVDLHTRSDGVIYSSPELRDWFHATVPASTAVPSRVVDGDLPKAEWLLGEQSPRISERDGQLHTVIAGRPMGPPPEVVEVLARHDVHLHVYSEKGHAQMRDWVSDVRRVAPHHLHLHPQVDQEDWVSEFSQYDAGWLHDVRSTNGGDLHAATWGDLNYPARIGTYAAAGIPMIQRDSAGSVVASERLIRELDLGFTWREPADLLRSLRDGDRLDQLRKSVWSQRDQFTFDAYAEQIVSFLRTRRPS